LADLTTLANVKQSLRLYPDKAITGITKANPGIVTCAGHGLQTGQPVMFSGVLGMTQINGLQLTVTRIDDNSFSVGNTSTFSSYTAGGFFGPDDVLLTRMIAGASGTIRNYLNRQISTGDFTEKFTRIQGQKLTPANFPITDITSLTVNGEAITASPDGIQNGFVFDDYAVYLLGSEFSFSGQWLNVVLEYSAGYDVVPDEIEAAAVYLVAYRYKDFEHMGQRSKVLAGETVSFVVTDLPVQMKTDLDQYRKLFL
jgi:Ubiquitin-activating enzyme E1 FCCH domain